MKNQEDSTTQGKLMWSLFSLLLVMSIGANYYFDGVSWAIRAAAGIFVAVALLFLALATSQGKLALSFAKSARYELTRVHWPKREETIQIAFRVLLMVVAATIVLWIFDNLFMWAMSWLSSGQGGA